MMCSVICLNTPVWNIPVISRVDVELTDKVIENSLNKAVTPLFTNAKVSKV